MTIFGGDLKIMGNSLDCNMMPTNIRKFVRKILSIKCHYLPVIYNRKFFVHDDKGIEMANRPSVLINRDERVQKRFRQIPFLNFWQNLTHVCGSKRYCRSKR